MASFEKISAAGLCLFLISGVSKADETSGGQATLRIKTRVYNMAKVQPTGWVTPSDKQVRFTKTLELRSNGSIVPAAKLPFHPSCTYGSFHDFFPRRTASFRPVIWATRRPPRMAACSQPSSMIG